MLVVVFWGDDYQLVVNEFVAIRENDLCVCVETSLDFDV